MGQQEVIDALNELGGTASRKQLQEYLDKNPANVNRLLKKLVRDGVVRRIGYTKYMLIESSK